MASRPIIRNAVDDTHRKCEFCGKIFAVRGANSQAVFCSARCADRYVGFTKDAGESVKKNNPEVKGCLLPCPSERCKKLCAKCGWNESVHAKRIRRIRSGGLVEDDDGIRRLHIYGRDY